MSPRARVGLFGLFACIWFLCGAWRVSGADSPARGPTDESGSEPSPAIAPHLQEQQELFQQAIEQARREMEEAASRNADALSQRLDRLQQSLEEQQRRELEAVQNSNRTTLMFAALLAGAGFLCLFCLAFFLMRATNRLTEVALAVPLSHALGPVHPALTAGQPRLTIGNPA